MLEVDPLVKQVRSLRCRELGSGQVYIGHRIRWPARFRDPEVRRMLPRLVSCSRCGGALAALVESGPRLWPWRLG